MADLSPQPIGDSCVGAYLALLATKACISRSGLM